MIWAFLLTHAGRIGEALNVLESVDSVPAQDFWTQVSSRLKRSIQADRAGAHALLTPEMVAAARLDGNVACYFASIFAILDDYEQALDCLQHAVNRGFINYPPR